MPASKTPIWDFVKEYAQEGKSRFHMPGHKGQALLGCENLDITEVAGADALYEAQGIIAQSEENATALFGSQRSLYSTEGSSQCIRALLYLCSLCAPAGQRPLILAARNVHKAFVYGAALLDLDVHWLWPRGDSRSLCSCRLTAEDLAEALRKAPRKPCALYVTSPDYLGGMADISELAQLCHREGLPLAVDNAHGAYLRFLRPSRHPLDLGADLCCDSAHKTLPVLTGGAYLHLGKNAPALLAQRVKSALELFGSTSPSYLTLCSLDRCNGLLAGYYPQALRQCCEDLEALRQELRALGYSLEQSDPLRLTLRAPAALEGRSLAQALRQRGIECEYADPEFVVLMATPQNREEDFRRLRDALLDIAKDVDPTAAPLSPLPLAKGEQRLSIRQALFAPQELLPREEALGRICAAPCVSCPPAIPIAVPGEVLGPDALSLMAHYGFETVAVVKD